jgi:DNA polymerase
MKLYLDTETASSLGIRDVGPDAYAESETTSLLSLAWAIDDGPVQSFTPIEVSGTFEPLEGFLRAYESASEIWATNARFDRLIIERLVVNALPSRLGVWRDAAVLARALGMPSALAAYTKILGCAEKKDGTGKILLARLSKSRWPGFDASKLDLLEKLRRYNEQDVRSMREAIQRMEPLAPIDWSEYTLSELINNRGIPLDLVFASKAYQAGLAIEQTARAKLESLGMGLSKHQANLRAMSALTGDTITSLDSSSRAALANHSDPRVRERIEALEWAGGVAHKKYLAMLRHASGDGRARGCFVYMGAGRTGRFSSKGIQVHNMRRDSWDPSEGLESLDSLGKALRQTIYNPKGLTWGDFSAIEARVLAWVGSADALLELFRQEKDVYIETARNILGKEDISDDERLRYGKVPVLALGYGGAVGAFSNMAKGYGIEIDDEQALGIVRGWRNANPWARRLWNAVEAAWFDAFRQGAIGAAGRCTFYREGPCIYIRLPSGRIMTYVPNEDGTAFRTDKGMTKVWGGLLTENICQGIARDVLVAAIQLCERVGIKVIGHVHDEIITEGDNREVLSSILSARPSWARGLPTSGKVKYNDRFGK